MCCVWPLKGDGKTLHDIFLSAPQKLCIASNPSLAVVQDSQHNDPGLDSLLKLEQTEPQVETAANLRGCG